MVLYSKALFHSQGRGHAVPTIIRFAFHTGQITGRRRDGPMAQEGGNVLDTGPVIPAKFGRRVSQIVRFEAVRVIQLPENSDRNWSVQEATG